MQGYYSILLPLDGTTKYCDKRCMSVRMHISETKTSPKFSVNIAVSRRCIIHYLLPTLRMTYVFLYIGPHGGVTTPQQPRCSVVNGLTPLIRAVGCYSTTGANTG